MSATRTLRISLDSAGAARAIAIPRYRLKVVKGPSKGFAKELEAARLLIGSAAGADFSLKDPTVSALHCELSVDDTGFRVRDLESKNGVRLGNTRVRDAWLDDGDELSLGNSSVRFSVEKTDAEVPLQARTSFGRLLGAAPVMRELYAKLERAAASDTSVLLLGETGTGKELAAEALVEASPRKDRPLVVVDCGRLPTTLAESELFGHERGAFTGANTQFIGAFERAHRGTVFLDEVGELTPELQAKLLGVLERRELMRVGGSEPIPIDVRVISATHRELPTEINRGTFRADLYFRLAPLVVRLPALRQHAEDIPQLVAHFLTQLPKGSALAPGALKQLIEADYPGNVRQLRAAVERAVLGLRSEESPSVLQSRDWVRLDTPWRIQKEALIAELERTYLGRLLEQTHGNVSEASRVSGINRVHLYEMIRRLQIQVRGRKA